MNKSVALWAKNTKPCTHSLPCDQCPRSNNHDQVHRPGSCCVQIALLPLRSGSEPRAHYLSLFLIAFVPLLCYVLWGFSSISLFRATHDTHAADCASCVARHVLCDAARIVPRMHMLWSSAVDLSLRHHVAETGRFFWRVGAMRGHTLGTVGEAFPMLKLPQSCPAPGAHSNPAL